MGAVGSIRLFCGAFFLVLTLGRPMTKPEAGVTKIVVIHSFPHHVFVVVIVALGWGVTAATETASFWSFRFVFLW